MDRLFVLRPDNGNLNRLFKYIKNVNYHKFTDPTKMDIMEI